MATAQPIKQRDEIQFRKLLEEVVTKPGLMLEAYRSFHNYSVGNQILALLQATERNIPIGPIASYQGWKEKGRHVKKGEKAIVLCRPVTVKRTTTDKAPDVNEHETERTFTRFVFKPHWFFLAQTDGQEYDAPAIPAWDRARALEALGVEELPFAMMNGNCQGYAKGNQIAINPLAQLPVKTTLHELAHVVLGHTSEAIHDSESTPRSLREAEAESTAMLCLEALGLDGVEYCRGYVQGWTGQNPIPERSAQKIFAAADKILKAGVSEGEERQ